jgi:Fis family transcriptional regulator
MYETQEHNVVRNQPVNSLETANNQQQTLRKSVERTLQQYFAQLGDQLPSNLYEMVLAEVEIPLLEVCLQKTRGNQTKTAKILGLSRGTLRKKLKQYDLD